MLNFEKIAILVKPHSQDLVDSLLKLILWLQNYGFKIYLDKTLNYPCVGCVIEDKEKWIKEVDLIIVIGGDGTMLAAGRLAINYNVPLLGINQGRLGFMTDILAEDMYTSLEAILISHEYLAERRSLLNGQVYRNGKLLYELVALNDIVISRGSIGSMIEFELAINHEFVQSQKSDGVIFATPTGSTAYSLASGGPILHPLSQVFSIVPICPQSMSNRPIVISDQTVSELKIVKDTPGTIHFDGQEYFDLHLNDKVIIAKAKYSLNLLHPKTYNYYSMLRNKLDWAKRVS